MLLSCFLGFKLVFILIGDFFLYVVRRMFCLGGEKINNVNIFIFRCLEFEVKVICCFI